jgi:SAM-dependent methyltransferase
MRRDRSPTAAPPPPESPAAAREVPHQEKEFFESFYRASVRGQPLDRMTIGPISDPEARFHYNAVENSIIRALLHRSRPPRGETIEAWRLVQQRQRRRLLDVGSGTGHWIDFFRQVFFVHEAIGIEISSQMAEHLRQKYAAEPAVRILETDIVADDFAADLLGGPVDWVSAIGVMFHIVDDDRWRRALANLAGVLGPGGLLFAGGDFGAETRNVQFHRSDTFSSWKEFRSAEGRAGEVRVNKRVRSLGEWDDAARACGLRIADLVRSDSDAAITTPENDLLVLERVANPG